MVNSNRAKTKYFLYTLPGKRDEFENSGAFNFKFASLPLIMAVKRHLNNLHSTSASTFAEICLLKCTL